MSLDYNFLFSEKIAKEAIYCNYFLNFAFTCLPAIDYTEENLLSTIYKSITACIRTTHLTYVPVCY